MIIMIPLEDQPPACVETDGRSRLINLQLGVKCLYPDESKALRKALKKAERAVEHIPRVGDEP